MAKKDYWQELCRMKHKTPDDVLLAEVILEIKKKKETEERKAKNKATQEHYLNGEKKEKLPKAKGIMVS